MSVGKRTEEERRTLQAGGCVSTNRDNQIALGAEGLDKSVDLVSFLRNPCTIEIQFNMPGTKKEYGKGRSNKQEWTG